MTDATATFLTAESLSDAKAVAHGFFTRRGGVSDGLYTSLNVGYGSGDDPTRVAENRRRAMAVLSRQAPHLNTVYQCHGADVAVAENAWEPADSPKADAIVTTRPGLAIGILTADCTPVLLADADNRVVGGAHAGWRGALGGVLAAAVDAMEALGATRKSIRAAVGPTIAQASYEVGPEFPAAFLDQDAENSRFFRPSERAGHHMFDLPGYVRRRLEGLGLGAIDVLDNDTCAESADFYSYRRATLCGEGDYGRGLSAIMLED
jgi:YfiH family protein